MSRQETEDRRKKADLAARYDAGVVLGQHFGIAPEQIVTPMHIAAKGKLSEITPEEALKTMQERNEGKK
jgi:hypothetical protein